MQRLTRITAVVVVGAVVYVATGVAAPRQSPQNDLIAYDVQPDNKDFIDLYTVRPDGVGTRRLSRTPGESETSPSWSPDHSLLAYATTLRKAVWVMRPDGSGKRRLATGGGNVAEFTPDGRVAFVSGASVVAVDIATRRQSLLRDLPFSPESLAFSRDGRTLYAAGSGMPLYRVDLTSRARPQRIRTPLPTALEVDVSPTGDAIAYLTAGRSFESRRVYVARPDGSGARRLPGDAGAYGVAFSPDGSHVAIVRADDRIAVVPMAGGDVRLIEARSVSGEIDW